MRQIDRGIAQLVEQRSPKPRAVSSRLTTPATNVRSNRSGRFVLSILDLSAVFFRFRKVFCDFCNFLLDKKSFFRYNNARSGGEQPRT